jgi:hypothetical protein
LKVYDVFGKTLDENAISLFAREGRPSQRCSVEIFLLSHAYIGSSYMFSLSYENASDFLTLEEIDPDRFYDLTLD